MTEREQIESMKEHYVMIGRPDDDGRWTLNRCTHFRLQNRNTQIYCTHGGWTAWFLYDKEDRLFGINAIIPHLAKNRINRCNFSDIYFTNMGYRFTEAYTFGKPEPKCDGDYKLWY